MEEGGSGQPPPTTRRGSAARRRPAEARPPADDLHRLGHPPTTRLKHPAPTTYIGSPACDSRKGSANSRSYLEGVRSASSQARREHVTAPAATEDAGASQWPG